MRSYFVRRILGAVPLLVGISLASFIFLHAMPGGPDALLARNSRMSAEQLAKVRRSLGLDQPMPVQYARWFTNILRGDFGLSFTQFRPVSQIIGERIPHTLRLVVPAILLSIALALAGGVISAVWRYSLADHIISGLSFLGLAMPVFWFGLMMQLLFSVQLGWLPSADMTSGDGGWIVSAKHLVMPVTTLAIGTVAGWSRYVRASTLEVFGQDFVRTARAKGLSERLVITRHALRNALIPFVTVVAIDIPFFLTGAVVTETIFSWPGLGRLFFDALRARDYPVLMGLLVYAAILIVIFNIIADLLYAWLDPRIKYR
ncbi:MAG: ABC transporter permease [Candidatus Brachytrichaceae bacterium NZ_4S206]|jgi:peptide/nickel transport system permease protein